MTCKVCGCEIQGVITICNCTLCNGQHGVVMNDGVYVASVISGVATHQHPSSCIEALKNKLEVYRIWKATSEGH